MEFVNENTKGTQRRRFRERQATKIKQNEKQHQTEPKYDHQQQCTSGRRAHN